MYLFWNMLFGGQQPVGMAVNLLIIVLFAVACLDIYRGRARLSRESTLVKEARATLHARAPDREASDAAQKSSEDDNGDSETKQEAPAAPFRPRVSLEKDLDIPADTLLGHRVARAIQLRLAGLGSRDVLQQLTSEKLGSYGSLARQIGASLTLLGLVGTVFGLSLALLNIGDTSANIKGVEDLGRLSVALGGTMGGMKTAFGCTLTGLLTALILSYLNYGLRRVQSVVLGEIEEFTACDLLPAIEQVDPESENATRAFANVLSKVSTDLLKLGSDLLDSAKEYRSSSSEVRETLDKLVGSVNQFSITIDRVAGNQEDFTKTMTATRETVDGVGAVVERSSELLLERLQQYRQDAEATAKVQQSMLSHHEEFKKLAEALKRAQTESLASTLAAHEKASKQLVEGVLKANLEELKKLVEGHHRSLDGILVQNREVMKTVSDMVCDVQMNGRAKAHSSGGVQ